MPIEDEPVHWDVPASHQMRLWQEREKQEDRPLEKRASKWDKAHVTISRQYGARGYAIGRLVAQKLGWEVYSRNLVDHISRRAKLREKVISEFDEKKQLAKLTQLLFNPGAYSSDKFYRHLVQVVLSISRQGRAVIIGRGANFICDKEFGLHVRVIADLESRIKRYAEKEGVTLREARRKVIAVDRERAEFVRHYFGADIEEPRHYDLVLNVEHFNNEQAADIIIAALEIKLGEPRPQPE